MIHLTAFTSCCQCLFFSYDLSGCLLIRLTPVSQGVALRPLSR
ncbi:hypothetical protein CPL00262_CDS0005 [Salmonella phage S147_CPL00262]